MTTEAKVDVLAVMDELRVEMAGLRSDAKEAGDAELASDYEALWGRADEARAAVAELVEAARDHRDCLSIHAWSACTNERRRELIERYNPEPGSRPVRLVEARFISALARVQP